MAQHSCGACGGPMRRYLTARDYNRGASRDIFEYWRCEDCGLASLRNIPQDLGRYYVSGYHSLPSSDAALEAGVAHETYKIELVRQFVAPPARLLEVGPSWGAFCLLAKRSGFDVEAIEMDPACCDFLRTRIGIPVVCSDDEVRALERVRPPNVIAAWHVLEHLPDPWRVLEAAAARLQPGGVLILALPNPQAFQFRVLGRFWTHVDAPRHLHLIPPALLRRKAAAAGLTQELCTTTDRGSLGWNRFGWTYSLPHLASAHVAKRALRFAGRVLGRVLQPLESREGIGAAYTAVFRKQQAGA
jgi:2-polyprenyl-3-methyl-5-hydroxy-6-metoxy-1,4-benzoquinol methylase